MPIHEHKVVATMCMLHNRYPDSYKTIRSLEGQVDTLYLCLNNFWEVPQELKNPWIEILHLGPNLGDAARFYLLSYLGRQDAHVISCDDDIEYPETYVQDYLAAHKKYPNALLTHHGELCQINKDGEIKYYTAVRHKFQNCQHQQLAAPASGLTFIPQSIFNQLEFSSLVHFNQADIHLACNCHKLGASIIALPHEAGYIRYTAPPMPTIYNTITAKPDRMKKVHKIFSSYGLEFTPNPPDEKFIPRCTE